MKDIEILSDQIEEELEDAKKYALEYMYFKKTDIERSRTYAELSREELKHAEMLHDQAVRLIREYQKEGKEAPAEMLAIWEREHKKMIKQTAKVKMLLGG